MFTRQHRAAVSLVVALSLAPAVAPSLENTSWAEAAPVRAEAVPPEAQATQAKQAYARGAELYKERKFTAAAAAFTEGQRLKPHYAFLWNLALTYHALGDHQKTIEYYQSYLASSPPTATADRAAAQAAIAAEQRSQSAPPPSSQLAQSLGHGTTSDKPAEGKVWRKWWFWTATGAAVAALGIGLGVGLGTTPSTEAYRGVTWR